jgi:hypothetical protein
MSPETPTRLQNQMPSVPRELRDELHRPADEVSLEVLTSGSTIEAIGGISAVVLAIVSLAGLLPVYLTAITAIVLAAALLFQGGSIASRFFRLISETSDGQFTTAELGGGTTVELAAGIAGIALGILALLGLVPFVLLPVAAIVFGAALMLGAGATCRLNHLMLSTRSDLHLMARHVARELVWAAAGVQVLIGLGAVVLGILALTGINALVLTAVAFLALGCGVLLSGTALTGRMLSMLWSR